MNQLQLSLLGAPIIKHGEQTLTFSTRKALALLVYLTVEGGMHTRKILSEAFWPELDAEHGRAALRATLLELRKLLERTHGPDEQTHLLIERDILAIDQNNLPLLDLHLVEVASKQAGEAHTGNLSRALQKQFEQAIQLVRGPFLASFTLRDSQFFDDWARQQREYWHLRTQHLFASVSYLYEQAGIDISHTITLTLLMGPERKKIMPSTQRVYDITHPGPAASDGVLARQALMGDQYAFELLVHRYRSPLASHIRGILHDDELVNDVLQYVFLRLSVCLPMLSTDRSLKAWLFQVARNRCLDELRRKRRRPEVLFSALTWQYNEEEEYAPIEAIPDPEPSPAEIAEQRDLQYALQQAILFLPPRLRSIVHMHSFRQLTFAEIGQRLNMRENTVKTYFHRALPLLRRTLVSNWYILSNT